MGSWFLRRTLSVVARAVRPIVRCCQTAFTLTALSMFFGSGLESHCAAQEKPAGESFLEWSTLPPLPDAVSGHFVGTSGGGLLVAGGSNFPEAAPWDGGEKVWHDRIHILMPGAKAWSPVAQLIQPTAYGVSISADDSVICIGGGNGERHSRAVTSLKWNDSALLQDSLPELPEPCAFMCGAYLETTIYIAGGQSAPDAKRALNTFWALDLSRPPSERNWETLEPWPGPERILAVAAAQDGAFYLIGGARLTTAAAGDVSREYLTDAYRYLPGQGWSKTSDAPAPVTAAVAAPLGNSHILVFGGDDGANASRVAELKERHPGFRRDVLAYETVTNTWRTLDQMPAGLVTTGAVRWNVDGRQQIVIPGGEDRPGHRSASVISAVVNVPPSAFGSLDYFFLAAYLAVMVAVGIYFSKREKSTEDFFLAGRRIPWWAAMLSIFSTQLSAITFMAIPGKAFATDWVSILMNLGIVLVTPLIVLYYLPFFRRLDVTTAYEYLERRFSTPVRLYGSVSFIVYQLGRMGIVLFLPSLALSTVTGLNVYACIVVMGILCIIYTALGGIEAVIWTDVLQTFVLAGGAILCLVVMISRIDGGFSEILTVGAEFDKFHVINRSGGLTSTVFWVVIVGGLFTQFIPYSTDQSVIQRYLTTPSEKQSARAIWTHAVLVVPASLIFFGLGTALFVFYRSDPSRLNPAAESSDIIFPWFIANELPYGLAGIVIAGLFAATMSSVDSSMNSIATAVVTDFYRRFRPQVSDHHCLAVARWLTVFIGVLATLAAVLIGYFHVSSLWDLFLKNAGLLGSSLAGIFVLGIFTRRANTMGTMTGAVVSIAVLFSLQQMEPSPIHGYLYAVVGIVTCVSIGYLASLLFQKPSAAPDGLTVYNMVARRE